MRTIYKYSLRTTDIQDIKLPKGAKILCVQTQYDAPMLWAEIDTDAEDETRTIEIFGTGNPIPSTMGTERRYIGTYQLHQGQLIFHAYEYTGI